MAVGKEILTKIRSVQNTQKITKAMQMVSTSKMRKTQDRMRLARPYAEKVRTVMSHLHRLMPIMVSNCWSRTAKCVVPVSF